MRLCHYDICPQISLHPNSRTLFRKGSVEIARGEAQSPLRKFQQAQEARNGRTEAVAPLCAERDRSKSRRPLPSGNLT